MVNTSVALAADRDNNLAAPRMERIKDPHFNRRTPGIMTLVHVAPAKAGSLVRSATSLQGGPLCPLLSHAAAPGRNRHDTATAINLLAPCP